MKTIEPLEVRFKDSMKLVDPNTIFCTQLKAVAFGELAAINVQGKMVACFHHDMLVTVTGNPMLSKYHEEKLKQTGSVAFHKHPLRVPDTETKRTVSRKPSQRATGSNLSDKRRIKPTAASIINEVAGFRLVDEFSSTYPGC